MQYVKPFYITGKITIKIGKKDLVKINLVLMVNIVTIFSTKMIDNEVFKAFAFYGALLAGKMMVMSFLTARQRFAKKVIMSIIIN